MSHLLEHIQFRTAVIASDALSPAAALKRIVSEIEARPSEPRESGRHILRLAVRVTPPSVLDWLEAIPAYPKFSWQSREDGDTLVGAGVAAVFDAADFASVDEFHAAEDDGPFGVGILTSRFDVGAHASATWRDFGACRVYVPRVALVGRDEDWHLLVHVEAGHGPPDWLNHPGVPVSSALPTFEALPSDYASWRAGVERVLSRIRSGDIDKAVLARTEHLVAEAPFSPLAIFRRLSGVHGDAFRFCIQVAPDRAFLGASPERLFERRGSALRSEAVAGTRVRGVSTDADVALATDLETSPKEAREHRFVLAHVAEALDRLCDASRVDPTAVHALVNVQHLRSSVHGRLRAGVGDRDILRALHPTPAVCGHPRRASLDAVRELESFDRGLYAGVVGRLGRDASECAVALRSGLVDGPTLTLFAGAGLVAGSDPRPEWEETTAKLRAIRDVLHAVER